MTITKKLLILIFIIFSSLQGLTQSNYIQVDIIPYKIYPQVNDARPNLPSPFINKNGKEYVIAVTKEKNNVINRLCYEIYS